MEQKIQRLEQQNNAYERQVSELKALLPVGTTTGVPEVSTDTVPTVVNDMSEQLREENFRYKKQVEELAALLHEKQSNVPEEPRLVDEFPVDVENGGIGSSGQDGDIDARGE